MKVPAADSARISAGRPIVGRERQLDRLHGALHGAEESHGDLVLLSGVAGIGKTRLAEAVAERAADHVDTVLWSSAWEGGGAPPYWPWTQVIRELVRDRPLEQIQADIGPGGEHVAQIAPDLAARLEVEYAPASPQDTEAARF